MAMLKRFGARKALTYGMIGHGWSNFSKVGERFYQVIGEYKIEMTREETEKLVKTLQEKLADPELQPKN